MIKTEFSNYLQKWKKMKIKEGGSPLLKNTLITVCATLLTGWCRPQRKAPKFKDLAMSDDDSDLSDSPIQSDIEEEVVKPEPEPEQPKKKGKNKKAAGVTTGGKKRKGPNANDDAPKPKRAKTAFMYFQADIRPKIRAQHPDASFKELGQLVADAWREATDEDKQPFVEMAGEDKARYQSEKDAVPKKPKKALTAFMCFSKIKRAEIKAQNPEAGFGLIAQKVGEVWKSLSEEEKVEFQKEADQDKQRYVNELAQYKADHPEVEG
jgi:hypothetical protein